jgi:hypothetical protein
MGAKVPGGWGELTSTSSTGGTRESARTSHASSVAASEHPGDPCSIGFCRSRRDSARREGWLVSPGLAGQVPLKPRPASLRQLAHLLDLVLHLLVASSSGCEKVVLLVSSCAAR